MSQPQWFGALIFLLVASYPDSHDKMISLQWFVYKTLYSLRWKDPCVTWSLFWVLWVTSLCILYDVLSASLKVAYNRTVQATTDIAWNGVLEMWQHWRYHLSTPYMKSSYGVERLDWHLATELISRGNYSWAETLKDQSIFGLRQKLGCNLALATRSLSQPNATYPIETSVLQTPLCFPS